MKPLPWTVLEDLRCPCCGSRLEPAVQLAASAEGLHNGTLRCECYEYPVAEGIAVLRQMSPVSSTQNEAVECLRRGDAPGALRWLLSVGSAPGVPGPVELAAQRSRDDSLKAKASRLFGRSARPGGDGGIARIEDFAAALHASRPHGYANYLFHRFANPSFLGAIAPLIVLGDACRQTRRARLLDLLCGTGHSSGTVGALCPAVEVVMADADYVNLFIARRFLAPNAIAVCMDVELPLPFSDGSCDALFCLDGLHYVRSKTALLREVDRVIGADGAWLFAHMHNASVRNVNPGAPLTAAGYSQRFSFAQQRLLPEAQILDQIRDEGFLQLTHPVAEQTLDLSNALTLMGARSDKLWRAHDPLHESLSRRGDLLALNPLYQVQRADDGLIATAAWPSESLRTECTAVVPLFSDTVHLRAGTLREIAVARAGGGFSDEVRRLVQSFVLVCLPGCYPRSELAAHEAST